MKKNVIDELIEENVAELLKSLDIGGKWMPQFGWYEKTGDKELTLKVRIYQQSVDTNKCLEKVEGILKSLGWTYKIDESVQEAGRVSNE